MRTARLSKFAGVLLLIAVAIAGSPLSGLAQQNLMPLRLSVSVTPNKLINVVAQSEGIYQKNGIDMDMSISPGSAETAFQRAGIRVPKEHIRAEAVDEDVVNTRSPYTIGGGVPTMNRVAKTPGPAKTVIILSTEDMTNWPIITSKSIMRPDQLKGKRIGVSGLTNTSGFQARLFVRTMGWNLSDVTFVPGVSSLEALKSGRVDAMTGDELTNFALKSSTAYHALVDFNEWKVPMASNGVNVDRAWLQDPRNRELTRRFVKSMVEAIAIMKQNKEATYRAMAQYYGITDPKMQAHFYEPTQDLPRKPYPTLDGIRKTMELFDSPEMRQHKPEDFYDDSFVRELDESGFIDSLYK